MKPNLALANAAMMFFALTSTAGAATPKRSFVSDPRDGKKYKIVTFGMTAWFAENLNFSTAHSWCYEDKPENCTKYGRLYDWSAAGSACPQGWRLPTSSELAAVVSPWSSEGGKSKALIANERGKSASGLDILCAGMRAQNGKYFGEEMGTELWSSSNGGWGDEPDVKSTLSIDSRGNITDSFQNQARALSVRCIKAAK
jgi:uncharacterized protein (TIGR02145 family)